MIRDVTNSSGRQDWRLASATAIWTSLIVITVVVLSRKVAGAFQDQLPTNVACLITLLATVLSLTASTLFQIQSQERAKTTRIVTGIVTLVPPMTLGVTLLPSNSILAVTFLAILFLLASVVLILVGEKCIVCAKSQLESTEPFREQFDKMDKIEELVSINSRMADSSLQLSQWMTRMLTDDGRDHIEGSVKIHFSRSQKQGAVHLTFNPPFTETPELTCEVLNHCPARLVVSVIHTYGARIDVRRTSNSSTAEMADVGYHAAANSTSATRKSDDA